MPVKKAVEKFIGIGHKPRFNCSRVGFVVISAKKGLAK